MVELTDQEIKALRQIIKNYKKLKSVVNSNNFKLKNVLFHLRNSVTVLNFGIYVDEEDITTTVSTQEQKERLHRAFLEQAQSEMLSVVQSELGTHTKIIKE